MSNGNTSISEESPDISNLTYYKIHYPVGDPRREDALFSHGTSIKITDHSKQNVLICSVYDDVEDAWHHGFPIHRDYVRLPSYEEKKAR